MAERKRRVDAVIVGYGWTGAIMAKALTDAGENVHEVGVIEPAPGDEASCVVDHAESLWRS